MREESPRMTWILQMNTDFYPAKRIKILTDPDKDIAYPEVRPPDVKNPSDPVIRVSFVPNFNASALHTEQQRKKT